LPYVPVRLDELGLWWSREGAGWCQTQRSQVEAVTHAGWRGFTGWLLAQPSCSPDGQSGVMGWSPARANIWWSFALPAAACSAPETLARMTSPPPPAGPAPSVTARCSPGRRADGW